MLDYEEISSLVKRCVEISPLFPLAGQYESEDIFRLVQRKSLITTLYKTIFPDQMLEEYVAKVFEADINIWDTKVKSYLTKDFKGMRFSSKTWGLMICEFETEHNFYKLIIPLLIESRDNIEFALLGVVPLAEPGSLLNWSEYAFITTSKTSNKETKLLLKFFQSRDSSVITGMDRFILLRLEDAALLSLMKINRNRLANTFSPQDMNEITILRAWSIMLIDAQSHNLFTNENRLEIDEDWQDFHNFLKWSLANDFQMGYVFVRKDENEGFYPDNGAWLPYEEAVSLIGSEIATSFNFQSPERYYINYEDRTRTSVSQLRKQSVTINEITKSIGAWEEEIGLSCYELLSRVRMGLKDDELLSYKETEEKQNEYTNRSITIDGVTKTTKEWAEETGISIKTIVSRLRYGWEGNDLILQPKGRGMSVRNKE